MSGKENVAAGDQALEQRHEQFMDAPEGSAAPKVAQFIHLIVRLLIDEDGPFELSSRKPDMAASGDVSGQPKPQKHRGESVEVLREILNRLAASGEVQWLGSEEPEKLDERGFTINEYPHQWVRTYVAQSAAARKEATAKSGQLSPERKAEMFAALDELNAAPAS